MRLVFTALLASLLTPLVATAGTVDLPRNPSISPDGKQIAFSWRGDLWRVASTGGPAVRLTSNRAGDLRSAWSPDGKWIAFNSRRGGPLNVFVMRPDGSEIRQVTHCDVSLVLGQFVGNGAVLVHGRREGDVHWGSRTYLAPLQGGPLRRLHDAYGHSADVSPQGDRAVFVRGRAPWTRRGYRGPATRDVWLYDLGTARFKRLTAWRGNDGMPHWIDDGSLVFASDRELNATNLYRMTLGGKKPVVRRLTSFRGQHDVTDLDVSADGKRAVFVAWDTLYTLDLTQADPKPQALAVTAPDDATDRIVRLSLNSQVKEAALSPDGKTIAYVAHGEVFVRAVGKHHPTRRVTDSVARDNTVTWSPDGARLFFVSDRSGSSSIYAAEVSLTRSEVREQLASALVSAPAPSPAPKTPKPFFNDAQPDGAAPAAKADPTPTPPGARWADALRFRITPVVATAHQDREPSPSPDGKTLAFRRGLGTLVLRDLTSQVERVLVKSWDRYLHWRWSPDGRHIAYAVNDRDFNSEVWVIPVAGGTPVNISMHPDSDWNPRWSADGKVLAFLSTRMGVGDSAGDVWMVYLDRELEAHSPSQRIAYYRNAAKTAGGKKKTGRKKTGKQAGKQAGKKKTAKPKTAKPKTAKPLDLADAYRRLRRVTDWPSDEVSFEMTPAGDTFVVATVSGRGGWDRADLHVVSYDGKGKRPVASKAALQHLDVSGARAVVVRAGRVSLIPLKPGAKPQTEAFSAKIKVDLAQQASQKFKEASRILSEAFYHPTLKGLDWRALTERYHSLATRARTDDEFSDVAARLIGELNASHLGIYPPRKPPAAPPNGRLGIDVQPYSTEFGIGFTVTNVLAHGPAARPPYQLQKGDRITGIERRAFEATDTLVGRLAGRVGKETLLTVVRQVKGRAQPTELLLLLTPIGYRAAANLRYEAWQQANAAKVAKWSGGRVGYLHIRGMNATSLVEFERDLYAAAYQKDALLIDVRNNGGGWTADRVLGSLMTKAHAYTVPRGADAGYTRGYPRGRLWIQRFTRPVNMLCNENSFSNAEILSHAFKTLKRGTLVGQQTYGGVISTGATTLVDGTRVRIPFRGWYLPDGTDMENNGALPHLIVPQTPQDEASGTDRQLRLATEDILKRLAKPAPKKQP